MDKTRIETRRVADLTPADYNPRRISKKALNGLSNSVRRFGLVQPVIWNERTGNVVGGHQRLKVLQAQGVSETAVVVVDLPPTEERALNVALNSPAISGEFDDGLQELLEGIREDDEALFGELMLDELLEPELPIKDGDDDVPDTPANPVTRPGDLWVLGEHRLLCGDSTSADDVGRACGELKPFIMVTDPPYGVNYDPGWRNDHLGAADRSVGQVTSDDRVSWGGSWGLFRGDVAYVWHGAKGIGVTERDLKESKLIPRTLIVWRKDRQVISRGHYHSKFESAWYAVRAGKRSRWCGGHSQSTVWEIATPRKSETGHGTQKPIECMLRPVANHGAPGDVVYDPFVGSGTTIIAAERAQRRCVALEIDPAYCDVIVERWQNATGGKATRG